MLTAKPTITICYDEGDNDYFFAFEDGETGTLDGVRSAAEAERLVRAMYEDEYTIRHAGDDCAD